jgi:thiaminase
MYSEKLVNHFPELWAQIEKQEIFTHLGSGTLPAETFRDLAIQSHFVCEAWKKFLGILVSKIPSTMEYLGGHHVNKFIGEAIANEKSANLFKKICQCNFPTKTRNFNFRLITEHRYRSPEQDINVFKACAFQI